MKLGCVPHSQLMRRNGIFRRAGVTFLGYNVVRFVCFTSNDFYLLPTSFLRHFPFLNSTGNFIDTLSRCGIRKRTFCLLDTTTNGRFHHSWNMWICVIWQEFLYSFISAAQAHTRYKLYEIFLFPSRWVLLVFSWHLCLYLVFGIS